MPQDENKTQDEQKEVSMQAETVEVASEKPVVEPVVEVPKTENIIEEKPISAPPKLEEVAVESEAVETPKVEEVTSEQNEQIEQPQNQTPPTAPIGEIPPSSSAEATADKQPQIQEKIIYKTDPNIIQKLLIKARAKIQERKQNKLDKIMTLFETDDPNLPAGRQVANKDIQKLLRTSRVSAFRYLNILEAQNKIKQVGNTGKSVFYTKI